ncbi:MFS transporter [Desulforhopalus sp. 52FAK]
MSNTISSAKTQKSYEVTKWSIFSILILTYVLVYFHRMAPGVVSEYLMSSFQITGTKLGTLSAIYFFVYAMMQLPSGVIADTLGTRTSVVSGNLVAGLGSILFGLAPTFEIACVGRFLVGLGVSVVFISIMKNNAVWFHERVFGVMSGLTLLIGNLGSVLAAGPLSILLTYYEWRVVFIGIGCISLILAVLGFLIVRNQPEDMGFNSPNQYKEDSSQKSDTHWTHNLLSVITSLKLWPGFWIQFGMIGGLYSFMGLWGVPYLRDVHGLDRSFAANHMTTMLLSFAFGAIFFGWFSDKIGRRKPLLILCTFCYLSLLVVLTFVPLAAGYQTMLLFGAIGFIGSVFVLTFAAAKEIMDPNLSGMAVSVVNMGCFIGTALMQPVFGYLADLSWDGTTVNGIRIYMEQDYRNGLLLMIIFGVLAFLGSLRVRETFARNQYHKQ